MGSEAFATDPDELIPKPLRSDILSLEDAFINDLAAAEDVPKKELWKLLENLQKFKKEMKK